jgi:hypothetical protein
MKKLLRVIAYAMALNFLAAVGGAAYLWKTHHLDRSRALAIKAIVFPPPATQPSAAAGDQPTTQPAVSLDDLLKKAAGRSADEQVEFIQRSFDSRNAQLDMRQRELADQQALIDAGRQRLAQERDAVEAEKKRLAAAEQQAANQANDQGFQDSLTLYTAMAAPQVKTIFMSLPDEIIQRYLEAMPTRTAAKIIKEFKTPDETSRIQKVLERMRQPATLPSSTVAAAP